MGIRFFVDPDDTVTKPFQVSGIDTDTGQFVTEDHWIELRAALSDKEWSELEMGIANRANAEGEILLDFAGASTKQLMVWVKAWSFYANGNPKSRVKPSAEYLGRLDRDVADKIRAIIQEHIAERKAEREAERNPTPLRVVTGDGDSETQKASSSRPKPAGRGTSSRSQTG